MGTATRYGMGLSTALALLPAPAFAGFQEDAPETTIAASPPSASRYEATWTHFVASAVSGDGNSAIVYGAKLDGYATIDGRDLGLWSGLTIGAHAELVYGDNVNNAGSGVLLPVNTALAFPGGDDADVDLAVSLTQRIGRASLTVGKVNMVDRLARTPLVGGGGREGFQHIAMAAPPSVFTPPSIFGALLTFPADRLSVTVGVWDAQSAVGRTGFGNLFEKGVAGMVALTLPVMIGDRRGFQSLTLMGDTKRGLDLEDLPDLLLPPESEAAVGQRRGGWMIRYAFQQFIWQDRDNPARGWGLFGQVSLWDQNPTPLGWSLTLGMTGAPPFAARPRDRFGLAYFRLSPSNVLRDGLAPILPLGPEQGAEAFYTFDVGGGRVRATLTAQIVDSARRAVDTNLFLGLRTLMRF